MSDLRATPFCRIILFLAGLLGSLAASCERRSASPPQVADAGPATVEPMPELKGVAAIKAAGTLRALILQTSEEEVPREGSNLLADRARVEALAGMLGVTVHFVPKSSQAELLAALRAGEADLIATPLPGEDALAGLIRTRPVKHVEDVIVVGRKAKKSLRNLRGLRRFKLLLPAEEAGHWRQKYVRELGFARELVDAPADQDTDDLLQGIGTSKDEAALVRSHELEDYQAYRRDVHRALTLKSQALTLVLPAGDPAFAQVIDGFLSEYAMTPHLRMRFGGDLADIRKRRVIRVAMLNNALAYFIYRGQQVGFQFELAELLSQRLGLRLEVVVPERPGGLLRLLVENRADLAVVTPNPENPLFDRCAYSLPIDHSDQVLVQPAGEAPITRPEELIGRAVHVRRSSQYFLTLRQLAKTHPGIQIVAASEDLETEALIDQVGRGEIPLTVSNGALLRVERTYRDDVKGSLTLSRGRPLVLAVRKESEKLLERLNRFVLKDCSGPSYQALLDKYFNQERRMAEVRAASLSASGAISPYDDLARKYGRAHGIDWRLILAQMYQESRFDPRAKSWAGARGLMQVMPQTGEELGLRDPWDPEQNVRVGVGYLAWLISRFESTLPFRQRLRFALAAYNAGLGHVRDARRLARIRRLDPDRWFENVEKSMLLLEQPRFYGRAKHGYCRGSEPVQYVSRIQDKYDAYSSLLPSVNGD